MRTILISMSLAGLIVGGIAAPVAAAPCKDAKGKFIACPKPMAKPVRCKNAKGLFAKCGTRGARPA